MLAKTLTRKQDLSLNWHFGRSDRADPNPVVVPPSSKHKFEGANSAMLAAKAPRVRNMPLPLRTACSR
jgi:hypothetical protein